MQSTKDLCGQPGKKANIITNLHGLTFEQLGHTQSSNVGSGLARPGIAVPH